MWRLWRRSPRRTLLLGIVALGVLVWSAMTQFDIPRERILESLLGAVLSLLLIMVLAAVAVGCWIGLRRLLRRPRDDER